MESHTKRVRNSPYVLKAFAKWAIRTFAKRVFACSIPLPFSGAYVRCLQPLIALNRFAVRREGEDHPILANRDLAIKRGFGIAKEGRVEE